MCKRVRTYNYTMRKTTVENISDNISFIFFRHTIYQNGYSQGT